MTYPVYTGRGCFLRRESDQREDGLRRAAFHPEKINRLKYNRKARVRSDTWWTRHGVVQRTAACALSTGVFKPSPPQKALLQFAKKLRKQKQGQTERTDVTR